MMEFYVGLDLHSNNTYLAIMEKEGYVRRYHKRLPNELPKITQALAPFQQDIQGIAVESTYNWYWLVDGLAAEGYQDRLHLANPAAMKEYNGLKYTDDKHDAFWLAYMLVLGILPTGYIYPKEERAVRDLLRKRGKLVQQHTSNLLALQSMVQRHRGFQLNANTLKTMGPDDLVELFPNEFNRMAASANLEMMQTSRCQIKLIEKKVLSVARIKKEYQQLTTTPGIGTILGLTITLETGDINRFQKVSNYSSYCRCTSSKHTSNNKKKGKGNTKNGNRYLAWAFIEAANYARRYNEPLNKYYQRKAAKSNKIIATKALANKLARISYYVMKNQEPFHEERLIS